MFTVSNRSVQVQESDRPPEATDEGQTSQRREMLRFNHKAVKCSRATRKFKPRANVVTGVGGKK